MILTASQSQALSELLALLLCGEQSAVLAFAHHAHCRSWEARAREDFTRIEADEVRHAEWIQHLQVRLPPTASDPHLSRQLKQFFARLGSPRLGVHLGRIAALDSAVCLILGSLRRTSLRGDPVSHLFESIHHDEARHVAIARSYARALCPASDLLECATETREQLIGILSLRAPALDTLGVCPDRLFKRLRNLPRGLFQ